MISIREHIVILCRPNDILGSERINVHLWCRVNQFNIGVLQHVCVPIVDHVISRGEVHASILEAEVIAHHNQHIGLRKVEFGLVRQPSIQCSTALRCVIRIEFSVINEWLVIRQSIKVEALWRTVVMEKLVDKNLRALSDRVPTWSPDPLHGLVC